MCAKSEKEFHKTTTTKQLPFPEFIASRVKIGNTANHLWLSFGAGLEQRGNIYSVDDVA